nr:hypothetical protein [uncultured Porphyromonas sp.]
MATPYSKGLRRRADRSGLLVCGALLLAIFAQRLRRTDWVSRARTSISSLHLLRIT